LEEYKQKKEEEAGITTLTEENVDEDGTTTTTTTTTTKKVETVVVKKASTTKVDSKLGKKLADTLSTLVAPSKPGVPIQSAPPSGANTPATNLGDNPNQPDSVEKGHLSQHRSSRTTHLHGKNYGDEVPSPIVSPDDKGKVAVPQESSDDVVIGLRVYTHRDVACSVQGRSKKDLTNAPVIISAGTIEGALLEASASFNTAQ